MFCTCSCCEREKTDETRGLKIYRPSWFSEFESFECHSETLTCLRRTNVSSSCPVNEEAAAEKEMTFRNFR